MLAASVKLKSTAAKVTMFPFISSGIDWYKLRPDQPSDHNELKSIELDSLLCYLSNVKLETPAE